MNLTKRKSSLHDDNNTTEGNKLLANNIPEKRDEHDVNQTFSMRKETLRARNHKRLKAWKKEPRV